MKSDSRRDLLPMARGFAAADKYRGSPATFNGHARITGPCGDTMDFWLLVKDDLIVAVNYDTDGCGTSSACGNTACCLVHRQSVTRACSITREDILDALGGLPEESEHCALLAADTLKAACDDYRRRRGRPADKSSDKKK